jgi:hypothetical protein
MGKTQKPQPVKLISGFIFKEEDNFRKASALLKRRFGAIDLESQPLPFDYTDYYTKEFGLGLKRSFISFKKLIDPQGLHGIKIFTNMLEKKLSSEGLRSVNIDPGYLDLAKLVLASTKDFSHRIYLNRGIWAEVTLVYQGKTFKPWEWTYPDYRSAEYISIFNRIREIYSSQIKSK